MVGSRGSWGGGGGGGCLEGVGGGRSLPSLYSANNVGHHLSVKLSGRLVKKKERLKLHALGLCSTMHIRQHLRVNCVNGPSGRTETETGWLGRRVVVVGGWRVVGWGGGALGGGRTDGGGEVFTLTMHRHACSPTIMGQFCERFVKR